MEILISHDLSRKIERHDGASHLPAAPNRNGSSEDHVMAAKALPSPEVLRQLLRYEPETGSFFWTAREYSDDTSRRTISLFNKRRAGKPAFTSINSDGYFCGVVCGASVKAHRVAWAIYHGQWPSGIIDHINGNRRDNRICNLRDVCAKTSGRNVSRKKTTPHAYPGIHLVGKNWKVVIGDKGTKYLGSFKTFEDALAARKIAELELGYHENHGRPYALTEWRR